MPCTIEAAVVLRIDFTDRYKASAAPDIGAGCRLTGIDIHDHCVVRRRCQSHQLQLVGVADRRRILGGQHRQGCANGTGGVVQRSVDINHHPVVAGGAGRGGEGKVAEIADGLHLRRA